VIELERRGKVLVIGLNRPQRRNAVNEELAHGIAAALDLLDGDDGLAVGVLTGKGGTFCAGMDLKAFLAGERPILPERGFAGLVEKPPIKPLCAAVEGYALAGGFEVMLACDLVVAASDAKFGLPEVKRGLIAGGGGIMRLAQRVAPATALEVILSGDQLGADRAYQLGLITSVTRPGQALEGAIELAERIAANAPLAVQASKRLAGGIGAEPDGVWAEHLEVALGIMDTEDAREGAAAFAERRPAEWQGK
jgi:enoyl-CoA hydratase